MIERPRAFDALVDKWLPQADELQLFGVPVREMTPDELAAVCAFFASSTARHPTTPPQAPAAAPESKRRKLIDLVRIRT